MWAQGPPSRLLGDFCAPGSRTEKRGSFFDPKKGAPPHVTHSCSCVMVACYGGPGNKLAGPPNRIVLLLLSCSQRVPQANNSRLRQAGNTPNVVHQGHSNSEHKSCSKSYRSGGPCEPHEPHSGIRNARGAAPKKNRQGAPERMEKRSENRAPDGWKSRPAGLRKPTPWGQGPRSRGASDPQILGVRKWSNFLVHFSASL